MAICMVGLFGFLFASAIPGYEKESELYAPHRILVKLHPESISRTGLPQDLLTSVPLFGIDDLDGILARSGGLRILRAHRRVKDSEWERRTGFGRWFIVEFSGRVDVPRVISEFKSLTSVEDACPVYIAYPQYVPNDPLYPNHWGHNNTAQLPRYQNGSHSGPGVGTPGFDARMQNAWDFPQGMGSAAIIIAIIDSGVDTGHPDLRLVAGWDYGDNDSNPMDNSAQRGHGTACAGVAAAIGGNNLGIVGSAGGSSVMPLKVANSAGDMYFTAIANAITHAADSGAHIASLSLGASVPFGYDPPTDAAFTYAYNKGVTIFAATANGNTSSIAYPSNHPHVISVGAASPSGERKSPSSSDGQTWWGSNYGVNIQDAANAVDIMGPTILPTTDITGAAGYSANDYYMWFNGTSCATPYVAGVAALVRSYGPTLTNIQLRSVLVNNATDMTMDGGAGWDRFTGYGMVNAEAALASFQDPPEITWSPLSISVVLPPNDTTGRQLYIGNAGVQTLSYTASLPTSSTLVLQESFESGALPTGWTQEFVTGAISWAYVTGGHNGNPSTAYNGTRNARLYINSTSPRVTRLITPPLNLSSAVSAELRFWHAQAFWSPDQDELRIFYKTSAVGSWILLQAYTSNVPSWTERIIPLPNLTSTYYIAFQGTAKYGYGVCVDLVTVTSTNPPPAPWLELNGDSPVSGSIAENDLDHVIPLNFDSTGLEEGEYNVDITLISNCPINPSVVIPVSLTVDSVPPIPAVPFVQGFENGLENWSIVNGTQTNKWHRGTAASQTGAFGAYISNDDGNTNNYTLNSASTVHLYRDIDFPAGLEDMWLRFDWRANGQSSQDCLRVYLIETISTPVAGAQLGDSFQIGETYWNATEWQRTGIELDNALAGQSKRLVFSWLNNASQGSQPPAALDNIRIVIGDNTDAAIVIDGTTDIIPPPVEVLGGLMLNVAVQINNLPPGTAVVTLRTSYAPEFAPWGNSGFALSLSGANFSGTNLMIQHGLGFTPHRIAYRVIPNPWQYLDNPLDFSWTDNNISIFLPSDKTDGDLDIVFPDSGESILPVTLSSFSAGIGINNNVQLLWITQSESNLVGFYVLKNSSDEIAQAQITGAMIQATNTSHQQSYVFTDQEAMPGTIYYWLQALELYGGHEYFGPVSIDVADGSDPNAPPIPQVTTLLDAYPNPFNPSTTIPYSIKEAGTIILEIYNPKGQVVRSITRRHDTAGYYKYLWDGRDANGEHCASGIYLIRMKAGKYNAVKRMALIK